MAKYQIINVKESSGTFEGNKFDNRMFMCYTDEQSKYLLCGENTCSLKMKADDFVYAMRSHKYNNGDLPDKIISPVFNQNGYMTDFTLSDPETGEVI